MELGPKNHNGDGLLGPDSIMVVYMDPLGYFCKLHPRTPAQAKLPGTLHPIARCQNTVSKPMPPRDGPVTTSSNSAWFKRA